MKKTAAFFYARPVILFLLFTVFAFLPTLLPFFYIKNDLVTQILPTRFFISESIHSGYFPWWNPYINFGIPQYSDMNCGFWNPILWITASVFRYNLWSITIEELFYLFLCGWGIFLLLKELGISKKIALLAGFSYMSSGYVVGHLQHFCWITGAAFLPFLLLYFLRINKTPTINNFISGALTGFLFLSSAHPGIIIGAIYLFAFLFTGLFLFRHSLVKESLHPKIVRNNVFFTCSILLLSAVVIVAYSEALPFLTRGTSLPGDATILNATTLQSYLSLFFPLAVQKSTFFHTDISMRNVWIGLLLIPGIFFFFQKFNTKVVAFAFVCLLFYILLSAGGIFKTIANSVIPLASYVRSSGEFSLFAVFIMVIVGAAGLDRANNIKVRQWRKILIRTIITLSVLLVILVFWMIISRQSLLLSGYPRSSAGFKEIIKTIIDHSTFTELFLIQGLINLATIYAALLAIKRNNQLAIAAICTINLVAVCWISLPFTGVGANSKKEVSDLLFSSPPGIPKQPLLPISELATADTNYTAFTGLPYAYLKIIGTRQWNPYPIQTNNNAAYFTDTIAVHYITQHPLLFMSADTALLASTNLPGQMITLNQTFPGYINATIANAQFNYITLLQNDYPFWQVYIDGIKTDHFTGYKTFISVAIPKKNFIIEFKFLPKKIITVAWLNGMLLLLSLIIVTMHWLKSSSVRNDF